MTTAAPDMTATTPDYRRLYEAAEAARIAVAAELVVVRRALRRETFLREFPDLESVVDLVTGDTDESYAASGRKLAAALDAARERILSARRN